MDKLKNLSLRKTITLYLCVSLILGFFLSALVVGLAENIQQNIWRKYADLEAYQEVSMEESRYYRAVIPRPSAMDMTPLDYRISELCDFLETYGILCISIGGSCEAVFLFYKHKLKPPIEELEVASKKIGKNNLDFRIAYENKDELGELCREFEHMRRQLEENNQKLWRTIEEEKALRAAVSHDIRSPLAVLKGYLEILADFSQEGLLNQEEGNAMLEECRRQLSRMEKFVESMGKISSLEKRKLYSERVEGKELEQEILKEIAVLDKENKTKLQMYGISQAFWGDREVILEVLENLLSNALRYSREQIGIQVYVLPEELRIQIQDDGQGFAGNPQELTKAFYQQNVKDSLKHTGMGMYISRLYCEKHGGRLLLENLPEGGAAVTAVFRRIK